MASCSEPQFIQLAPHWQLECTHWQYPMSQDSTSESLVLGGRGSMVACCLTVEVLCVALHAVATITIYNFKYL
jgi:hypothetical protein